MWKLQKLQESCKKLQAYEKCYTAAQLKKLQKVAKSCKKLQVIQVVSDSSNWHIIYVLESIDNNHKHHLFSIIECPRKHKYHYLANHQNHII